MFVSEIVNKYISSMISDEILTAFKMYASPKKIQVEKEIIDGEEFIAGTNLKGEKILVSAETAKRFYYHNLDTNRERHWEVEIQEIL